jgi:hypothetical protein
MKETAAFFVVALSMLGSTGCAGSAALIARTRDGGVMGLDGERSDAMADARRQMGETCGGAYTITGERIAVAGTYRGRTISETQIRFACGAQPDQPAGTP